MLGVVENMSGFACPMCRAETPVFSATTGGGQKLAIDNNLKFLGSVPMDPILALSGDLGKSLNSTSSPIKEALAKVIDNIISAIKKS